MDGLIDLKIPSYSSFVEYHPDCPAANLKRLFFCR